MAEKFCVQIASIAVAEQLAQLAERTFRDAFAKDSSPEDMDAYVRDSLSLSRIRSELADEASTFLMAFRPGSDAPLGYSKLRAGKTNPSVTGPDPIKLERLYVDQSAIGSGVGATLMRASLNTAQLAGYRTLWLGVWERNQRAIAFYERWEFETVGNHVFVVGSEHQTDLVMARPVPVLQ